MGIALIFVDGLIYPFIFPGQVTDLSYGEAILFGMASDTTIVSNIFSVLTFIPTLSAGARRLHDINKSGWYQAIFLAPLLLVGIGAGLLLTGLEPGQEMNVAGIALVGLGSVLTLVAVVLLIVWLATDSDRSDNRFGSSPKYGSQARTFD